MEEKANTGQVIIVLTEHLTFGTLLIPYMAEKSDDGTYQLIEQAFHASPEAISRMNEAEQQAIDIASHYTEKYLMGIYSREKTVSRFLRKLSEDPERVKNNIRPFIEKKMQEMLTLIRHHNLPLYQKQVGSKLLYAHHAYHVHPHDVEIRFTFLADETNFRYQLQCYYDGQPLSLSEQKPVIVLTSSPSALLLGMELYFFPHIESVRILPFTKKKKISVPASQIEKYIDNIVIPIARYHEITTQGLNIIEETYACEAVLSLEDTIYDEQMLRLSFRYGDQSFTPDTVTEMKKIIYRNDFGEIFFFRRDSDAEEEKLRMLTDSGLQRVSDVHFKLSPDAPEKTITEWINTYREMLQQSFLLTGNMENTPYCLDEIRIEQSCDDEPDWFELHITVVIGNLRIPFSRFRKHILEEKREFLLPDGRMILLPEEWFSKYGTLLELGTQTETGIRLKPTFVGAVQSALEENGPKNLPFKREIRNVPVPQGLKAELRPYQQKGFSWMVQLNKQGFGGCLIVVSHDRYFMNKVVDHLLVFEGEGRIRDFPGNYDEYLEWKQLRDAELRTRHDAESGTVPVPKRPARNDKRRLSFNEKRELERLEKEIPELEARKAELEQSLCSGTLPIDELTRRSVEVSELIGRIDELSMRWLELSEIGE